jgi:HSP20 family molecular chaperone IbpA
MTKYSIFSSPLLLGFEHIERALGQIPKNTPEGFPPYNIEQIDDYTMCITLAVAGFSLENLHIQLEGNQLIIRGKQADDPQKIYVHRGIATRQFQRQFMLADGLEVEEAEYINGLLNIYLRRKQPHIEVQSIKIQQKSATEQHRIHFAITKEE